MRRLIRFERRHEHHAAPAVFFLRLALFLGLATLVVGSSLAVGMWGYAHYEGLGWRDAFLNAAMLLGGMGPVEQPQTPGGKVFAGVFALYAGLVFLVAAGLILAPVLHRVLHAFHVQEEGDRGRGA